MQVKMEAEAGLPDIAKTVLARALQVLVFIIYKISLWFLGESVS